ncbi:MAG TPA: twin-arginine translocase subunit TatC [Bacteroidota bacterium]|nr:twin-arginine translocase subunit TatC [Bacteroidota bacterium]
MSTDEPADGAGEMSFLDHLEELRWRIIKALLGVVVSIIICGIFSDWLVNVVLLGPLNRINPPLKLINTVPYGQITFYMMVIIVAGLILSSPWILYQIWKFVQPGLRASEQMYISGIVGYTSLCFLLGVAFSYFLMLPYMLQFFASFGSPMIQNMISVDEYMSFTLQLVLLSGLIFELPMVSYFLARFGILTPAFMRHYRRHAIVVILFIAAVVTPTTDPVTMSVFSIPMLLLYEISIWVAKIAVRKRNLANASNLAS